MNRLSFAVAFLLVALSQSFTTPFGVTRTPMKLAATDQDTERAPAARTQDSGPSFTERGVSVDQDGKSNVWAIEPKIELESKSSEEKSQGLLIAGGGIAAAAAAALVILSNLPDPNQF